jgi:protein phosphatase
MDNRQLGTEQGSAVKIAVISDIHANLPALEAVLQDIEARKADRIICLGDVIGKGPSNKEAVDICRSECDAVIVGNWDKYLYEDMLLMHQGEPEKVPESNQWYIRDIGDERMEYLGSLPHYTEFMLGGKLVRLFHAHPKNFNRYFSDSPKEQKLELFEPNDGSTAQELADIAIYADIHVVYMQFLHGRQLLNVGSVGNPLDIPQASYVMLEGGESGVNADFIRIPYDIEKAIQNARTAGSPHLDGYISELKTAKYYKRG